MSNEDKNAHFYHKGKLVNQPMVSEMEARTGERRTKDGTVISPLRENKRIARLAKQHHKDCIRLRGAAECNCQSLYDFAKKCRPKTVVGPRCFLKKHSLHSSGYITNRDYVDGE